MAPTEHPSLPRRVLLRAFGAAALASTVARRAGAHDAFGPVLPPRASPFVGLVSLDHAATDLSSLLRGAVTAVQLMFTGCSATCPIQGAIFAELQGVLAPAPPHLRLLSLSIDPLGDDAAALRRWLLQHAAQPGRWTAALSTARDLDLLLDFLRARSRGADRHTPQVYLFDRQARLRYRTIDLPPAASVARLMTALASQG